MAVLQAADIANMSLGMQYKNALWFVQADTAKHINDVMHVGRAFADHYNFNSPQYTLNGHSLTEQHRVYSKFFTGMLCPDFSIPIAQILGPIPDSYPLDAARKLGIQIPDIPDLVEAGLLYADTGRRFLKLAENSTASEISRRMSWFKPSALIPRLGLYIGAMIATGYPELVASLAPNVLDKFIVSLTSAFILIGVDLGIGIFANPTNKDTVADLQQIERTTTRLDVWNANRPKESSDF